MKTRKEYVRFHLREIRPQEHGPKKYMEIHIENAIGPEILSNSENRKKRFQTLLVLLTKRHPEVIFLDKRKTMK